MRDIRISDHGEWRHLHWNAIVSAYGESPFFDYYADDLRPFFELKANNCTLWINSPIVSAQILNFDAMDGVPTYAYDYDKENYFLINWAIGDVGQLGTEFSGFGKSWKTLFF